MATVADKVLQLLQGAGRPLDDDAIAAELGVVRQRVNQECRRLEARGRLERLQGPSGKLVNQLLATDATGPRSVAPEPALAPSGFLPEDDVKRAVSRFLEAQGFTVTVKWGRERGIDLDARRGDERWVIEAKGGAPRGPQQVNYFLNALGELVQRMDDETARFGLALPDDPQYRGLVERLPALARRRLGLTVFFVRRAGQDFAIALSGPDWLVRGHQPVSNAPSGYT